MSKYATVNMLRMYDDALFTSDVNDAVLARLLVRAESAIDSAMGFDFRLGGFEPHVAWVQAQWDAKTLKQRVPNFPVPIRRVNAYKIQVSTVAGSGAGFFANLNTSDVSYNTFDDYIEVVPLQSITYSLAPVILNLSLRPPIAQIDYEAGYYLPVSGETLLNSYILGGSITEGDLKTYSALHGFWATAYNQATSIQPLSLPPVPPIIYKNGSVQSSGLYDLNAVEGQVVFHSALHSTDAVTADYTYQIPQQATSAAVAQASWIAGQRALNKSGMAGVELTRMGQQQIQRPRAPRLGRTADTFLCDEAFAALAEFMSIGVG